MVGAQRTCGNWIPIVTIVASSARPIRASEHARAYIKNYYVRQLYRQNVCMHIVPERVYVKHETEKLKSVSVAQILHMWKNAHEHTSIGILFKPFFSKLDYYLRFISSGAVAQWFALLTPKSNRLFQFPGLRTAPLCILFSTIKNSII